MTTGGMLHKMSQELCVVVCCVQDVVRIMNVMRYSMLLVRCFADISLDVLVYNTLV